MRTKQKNCQYCNALNSEHRISDGVLACPAQPTPATHTPTPLVAIETGESEGHETFELSWMKSDGFTGGYRWFTREDAAFIVQAVNAHKALLSSCKIALNDHRRTEPHHADSCDLCVLMKDALAKAEGR